MINNTKSISFRPTILGESVTFLGQEEMGCVITQEGLVELISQLVFYKEEGRALYPEIYIFDDLNLIKQVLPTSKFCFIGAGEKSKDTMLKALKKCAPLADGGWAIYILRKPDGFEYGVFRAGTSMLSVSLSEILINNGSEELKAILIHQVADKLIEVKGVKKSSLVFSFGSQDGNIQSPTETQSKFIETIVAEVSTDLQEATTNFFKKLFLDVLQRGHGTLACVINYKKSEIPKRLNDAIILKQRISVPGIIKELLDKGDLQSNAELEGQYCLLRGMMLSDGITVFTNKGEIASYNVFVKHPEKQSKNTSGGARSRTFLTLCNLVGNGIESAYIQSQDGKIEYKKHGE